MHSEIHSSMEFVPELYKLRNTHQYLKTYKTFKIASLQLVWGQDMIW